LASILDSFLNGGILNAYHLKLDDQVFKYDSRCVRFPRENEHSGNGSLQLALD
jgi:hypothetical protein